MHYVFGSAGETNSSDKAFRELRTLQEHGIIKQHYRRLLGASNDPSDFGETEFCAVASSAWRKNRKSCRHWVLRITGASIGDYLSIYNDRRSYAIAKWGAIIAAVVAVLIAIAQAAV